MNQQRNTKNWNNKLIKIATVHRVESTMKRNRELLDRERKIDSNATTTKNRINIIKSKEKKWIWEKKATKNQFDEKRIFCELFQMMCVIVAAKTFILFTCFFSFFPKMYSTDILAFVFRWSFTTLLLL